MNDIKKDMMQIAHDTSDVGLVYLKGDNVWCENAGDFTLPDYMPEIGKMLTCTPRLIPSGKYIGSDRAEFSGSVVYSLMYTGDDGLPFCTTLSGEYEYSVPLGEAADSARIEIYEEPVVESVSVRASGPRKISVRTRIRARPFIAYEKKITRPDIPSEADNGYQRLTEGRKVSMHRHFESGEFSLSEEFKLDTSPDAEPVACDGLIYVTDIVRSGASVICRGEVECSILYYDIEGGRRKLLGSNKKLRFEKEITMPETEALTGVRAYGRVISTDMSVSEDSSVISVNATIDILGDYTTERDVELVRDIYSCKSGCSVKYESTEYFRGVMCRNLNVSCHAEKQLPESDREYDVCASFATPKVNSVNVFDGIAEFTGEILVDCLLSGVSGEGVEYTSVSVSVPFKCEAPTSAVTERYEISVLPESAGVRTRIEKEKLSVDCEVYLSAMIEGAEGVSTVKSVCETAPSVTRSNNGITVYYPDKGETLWSVAKKYSVMLSATAEVNGLSADHPDSPSSLDGVECMLII